MRGVSGRSEVLHSAFFCLDILEDYLFHILIQSSLFVNFSFMWLMDFVIWLINNWWSSSRKTTKILKRMLSKCMLPLSCFFFFHVPERLMSSFSLIFAWKIALPNSWGVDLFKNEVHLNLTYLSVCTYLRIYEIKWNKTKQNSPPQNKQTKNKHKCIIVLLLDTVRQCSL